MSIWIIVVFIIGFALRLVSLSISIQTEKRLKLAGAVEYGQTNSTLMAVLHFLFYIGVLTEALLRKTSFDTLTSVGIGLYAFALAMLFYVIHQLQPIWTVKLIIAPEHPLNQNPLFKIVRHPNYFLNIIPELLALILICKAWIVLAILFPLYLVTLIVRIIQEEKVMKTRFPSY